MAILRRLLPLMTFFASSFFVRFLGSEGIAIMTTGINLVIYSIILLGIIFMFRLSFYRLNKKYGFRLVFILYLSILFCISFFFYLLRIYFVSHLGLYLSAFLILSVGELSLPAHQARLRGRRIHSRYGSC